MDKTPELKKGIYQHWKGGKVEVLEVVRHSETLEPMVLYRHVDGEIEGIWVRPFEMFVEDVEHDGRKTIPRFRYTGE